MLIQSFLITSVCTIIHYLFHGHITDPIQYHLSVSSTFLSFLVYSLQPQVSFIKPLNLQSDRPCWINVLTNILTGYHHVPIMVRKESLHIKHHSYSLVNNNHRIWRSSITHDFIVRLCFMFFFISFISNSF